MTLSAYSHVYPHIGRTYNVWADLLGLWSAPCRSLSHSVSCIAFVECVWFRLAVKVRHSRRPVDLYWYPTGQLDDPTWFLDKSRRIYLDSRRVCLLTIMTLHRCQYQSWELLWCNLQGNGAPVEVFLEVVNSRHQDPRSILHSLSSNCYRGEGTRTFFLSVHGT